MLKNNSLAEVKFEQRSSAIRNSAARSSPIDFVAFAKACGADGFRCTQPDEVRPAIAAMLASPGAALLEAVVDANEPPLKPDQLKG